MRAVTVATLCYASDARKRVKSGGGGGELEGDREEAGGSKDRKWEIVRDMSHSQITHEILGMRPF